MDRRQNFGSGLFGTNAMEIPGKKRLQTLLYCCELLARASLKLRSPVDTCYCNIYTESLIFSMRLESSSYEQQVTYIIDKI